MAKGMKKHYVYEFRTRRIRRSMAMDAPSQNISHPESVAQIVRHVTKGDARESFLVFFIDSKNNLLGYEVIAVGSLVGVEIHPRELFRPAIVAPAAAIIVAHNHPSGDSTPSQEDLFLTERIQKAGELLGIPLMDHVVVTDDDFTSIHSLGLIDTKDKPK